jgi:hypothetical protein
VRIRDAEELNWAYNTNPTSMGFSSTRGDEASRVGRGFDERWCSSSASAMGGVAGFPGVGAAPHSGKEKEWLDARLTKHNQPTKRDFTSLRRLGQHRTTGQGASFDCAAAHPPNPDSFKRPRTADGYGGVEEGDGLGRSLLR